ncbi:LexA family protein [Sphingomonas aestuarii]
MSPQQLRTLDFVREHISTIGVAPTQREVATHLGRSRGAAVSAIDGLVARGKLRRRSAASRGLELAEAADLRTVPTDEIRAELARRGVTMDALARPRALNYGRRAVTCAADSCHVEVRRGHLMCWDHWSQLPRALQQEILTSFGRRDEVAYGDAVRRARDLIDGGRS